MIREILEIQFPNEKQIALFSFFKNRMIPNGFCLDILRLTQNAGLQSEPLHHEPENGLSDIIGQPEFPRADDPLQP